MLNKTSSIHSVYLQWCFHRLAEGLICLKLIDAIRAHPELLRPLFVGGQSALTTEEMLRLFEPVLSPPGSNMRRKENLALTFWRDWIIEMESKCIWPKVCINKFVHIFLFYLCVFFRWLSASQSGRIFNFCLFLPRGWIGYHHWAFQKGQNWSFSIYHLKIEFQECILRQTRAVWCWRCLFTTLTKILWASWNQASNSLQHLGFCKKNKLK